jgi:hypothetical protein
MSIEGGNASRQHCCTEINIHIIIVVGTKSTAYSKLESICALQLFSAPTAAARKNKRQEQLPSKGLSLVDSGVISISAELCS